MVICLERGADLHMAQLMPLPLTVSCFSKIQIGFTFMVLAHLGSPGQRAVKRVCVCVCLYAIQYVFMLWVFARVFYGKCHCTLVKCKSGDLSDVNNYRAITIYTAVSKLFVSILLSL